MIYIKKKKKKKNSFRDASANLTKNRNVTVITSCRHVGIYNAIFHKFQSPRTICDFSARLFSSYLVSNYKSKLQRMEIDGLRSITISLIIQLQAARRDLRKICFFFSLFASKDNRSSRSRREVIFGNCKVGRGKVSRLSPKDRVNGVA